MATTFQNYYAFINVVMKLCEIIACPTCKQRERRKTGTLTSDFCAHFTRQTILNLLNRIPVEWGR